MKKLSEFLKIKPSITSKKVENHELENNAPVEKIDYDSMIVEECRTILMSICSYYGDLDLIESMYSNDVLLEDLKYLSVLILTGIEILKKKVEDKYEKDSN